MNYSKPHEVDGPSVEGSPYIHLFKTEDGSFVLDLHTNRMFSLDDQEANFFQEWKNGGDFSALSRQYAEAARSISLMRDQGLFCCERPHGLAYGCNWEELVELILNRREITVIEITQQCNLRCRYCTFGGGFEDHRIHSTKRMDKELLREAIEEAIKHGSDLDQIFIGFYGGEPLLAFDLVQEAVAIAEKKAPGKSIGFSITTNATLIDTKKSEFLRDKGFTVLVSVDGPPAMHNRYRVYPDGVGSYSTAIKGLRTILEIFPPDMHHKIGLNMVVPTSALIPALEELWDAEPWLPRSLRTSVTVVMPPHGLELPASAPAIDSISFTDQWISHVRAGKAGKTTLESTLFDGSYARLHKRPIMSGYRKALFPNGCCIPGARKVFIDTEGRYQICEKVHGAPSIGSVERGIDFTVIERIISDYCTLSFRYCRDCFCISTCNLCFMHAYRNGTFDIEQKWEHCRLTLQSIQSRFKIYAQMSQAFPYKLDEWEGYDFK
jgi:uncharacterized protein